MFREFGFFWIQVFRDLGFRVVQGVVQGVVQEGVVQGGWWGEGR